MKILKKYKEIEKKFIVSEIITSEFVLLNCLF